MLNIQIDDPELEKKIRYAFGGNDELIGNAFVEFIQLQKIKRDAAISIRQHDAGHSQSLSNVMGDVRAKYKIGVPV